jgi:Tfp pilus assembly protein PilF
VIWEQVLNLEYELQQYEALYQDSKACLVYFTSLNRVYLFNGIGALQTKRYSEAIDAFTMGLELITNEKDLKSEFLAQRGEAHFFVKNTKSGIEDYEAALKLFPTSNYIKNNYAYRLSVAKLKFELAEKLIQEALVEAPTNGNFLDTYGWILFQQGKFQEAEIPLKKALVTLEKDAFINEHLGDVYIQMKQTQNALFYWQKAKEYGSTNPLLDKKIQQKSYYEPIE